MLAAPEKLDVDGVGGARLESMAAKAAEWRKSALQESSWRLQCECPSVGKAIPDCFSSSAVVSVLCKIASDFVSV